MTAMKSALLALPVIAASAVVLPGCQSGGRMRPAAQQANVRPAAPEKYPVIVRLVGRHFSVTASSGPHGVVYSAHGSDGRLIIANAGLDELRRAHPDIYQQLIPGIAEHGEVSNSNRRRAAESQDAVPTAERQGPRAEAIMLMAAE